MFSQNSFIEVSYVVAESSGESFVVITSSQAEFNRMVLTDTFVFKSP